MAAKLGLELSKYLDQIVNSLKNNRASVLVGAGFSRNADGGPSSTFTFPTWNELADIFFECLFSDNSGNRRYLNPLALAEQVEAAYGRPVLDKLLTDHIPDIQCRPSVLHEMLLRLPWSDVFTTNYDTLLERASQEITEKRFNVVTRKEDLVGSADVPRIIKLHGSFPSHRPFVITTEDYRRYPRDSAHFVNTMQQSLLENTLCLIGFSGDDPNFLQWIGWIHDNLGLDNSPFIYLFTHNDFPDVQKKLLYQKKVIVLDISPLAPNGETRDCYLKLLERLLSEVSTKQPLWPGKKLHADLEGEKTLVDIVESLRQIRTSDPGWLVLPYSKRESARNLLQIVRRKLYTLSKSQQEGELAFLYEYDWLRNRCLQPLFSGELRVYRNILDRRQEEIKSENPIIASILLSLLQYYRLNDDRDEWEDAYNRITGFTQMMNEQRNRLTYELCLFSMFRFDFQKFKSDLEQWEVDTWSFEWALRKAGLLTECNELQQASMLLQNSLSSLRRQLQHDSQSVRLLSLESAQMSLKRYIEQVVRSDKGDWDAPPDLYDAEAERRLTHHKYDIDWYAENERFGFLLTAPKKEYRETTTTPAFEFGRQTVSFHSGEDTDAINAYAFLLFREETGFPFRVHNFVIGNKAAVGAAERIARYSFSWAVITIVRTYEEKALDLIFTRSALSIVDAQEVDALCKTYLEALRRVKDEIAASKWYSPVNFAGFAAGILPKLLSFLCCKCSLAMLDEMLGFLLDIYRSELRMNYRNIEILMSRLTAAFSDTELISRVPMLLRFPLLPEDIRIQHEFPDPILFIQRCGRNVDINLPADPEIDIIFSQSRLPGIEGQTALARLIILSEYGFLSERQNTSLGEMIWKEGLHLPNGFYRTLCLRLPYPADVNMHEEIKKLLLADLVDRESKNFAAISLNDTLLPELEQASLEGLFGLEDFRSLLSIFLKYQERLTKDLQVSSPFGDGEFSKRQLYHLSCIILKILLSLPEWQPTDTDVSMMEQILKVFQEYEVLHPALQVLWARRCSIEISEEKLFENQLLTGSEYQVLGVYETLLSETPSIREMVPVSAMERLLALTSQQIFWRGQGSLVSAMNVMSQILRSSPTMIAPGIERSLIFGLSRLLHETTISDDDSVEVAAIKGSNREAAARLSMRLYNRFVAESRQVPGPLLRWREVCGNPNEFAEIRNAGN